MPEGVVESEEEEEVEEVETDDDGDDGDDDGELLCLRGEAPPSPPSSLRQSIEEGRLLLSSKEKEEKRRERKRERNKEALFRKLFRCKRE